MGELKRRYVAYVLKLTKGMIDGPSGANAILSMGRSTLYNYIKQEKLFANDAESCNETGCKGKDSADKKQPMIPLNVTLPRREDTVQEKHSKQGEVS